MFYLVDNSTLDTVVKCSECFGLERFDTLNLIESTVPDGASPYLTDRFRVFNAIEQAKRRHECPVGLCVHNYPIGDCCESWA